MGLLGEGNEGRPLETSSARKSGPALPPLLKMDRRREDLRDDTAAPAADVLPPRRINGVELTNGCSSLKKKKNFIKCEKKKYLI